jgi:hypothetical protein
VTTGCQPLFSTLVGAGDRCISDRWHLFVCSPVPTPWGDRALQHSLV